MSIVKKGILKEKYQAIIVIIVLSVLFGQYYYFNKDPKTVLVNEGEWYWNNNGEIGEDYESKTYVFFDDGHYEYEQTDYDGENDCTKWQASGDYRIKDGYLYLDEEERKISSNYGLTWDNLYCKSRDYSLEIIDSDTIKISGYKFT